MEPPVDLLRPRQFETLSGIAAGFSTRRGGVSEGAFDALNVGLSTGDTRPNVLENRRRLFATFGLGPDRAAIAGQVHGADVLPVTEPGLYRRVDGLVTATPELLLCITAADCAAVLLADPEARVVGACHSGWRGTVAEISVQTVEAMQALGATPSQMYAYISPCISAAHFEVGREVAARFDERFVVPPNGQAKPHVDLKAAIADQLARAGVPSRHVETSPHCTYAETDRFYSYRAENGDTGRMMGLIALVDG